MSGVIPRSHFTLTNFPFSWKDAILEDMLPQVREHLEIAVEIELHTIPLYLFAAYSVNGDENATSSIIDVVIEEMLHLALAGNILSSIGGEPRLYGEGYTPTYPFKIFEDDVELNLRPVTKSTLESFVQLERPKLTIAFESLAGGSIIPEYKTIGDFYRSLDISLQALEKKYGPNLFRITSSRFQFSPEDNLHNEVFIIDSLEKAESATKLIIVQGEGAGAGDEHSHYNTFRRLAQSDIPHYDLVENPKTENFKGKPFYEAMVASDAIYCYLLLTIEKAWKYAGPNRPRIIQNIQILMRAIKIVSKYLIKQPINNGDGKFAASCFNHYEFHEGKSFDQLMEEVEGAIRKSPELKGIVNWNDLVDIDKLV